MRIRSRLNASMGTLTGYQLVRMQRSTSKDESGLSRKNSSFSEDGLRTNKNVSAFGEARFERAYAKAIAAGGRDYGIRWRTHVMLWVSEQALKVPGDFVELGVGRGWMFAAICDYLDIDSTDKHVHLFDRFTDEEVDPVTGLTQGRRSETSSKYYASNVSSVVAHFSQYASVTIVQGSLPQSLSDSPTKISFVHVDLNAVNPEIESLAVLWPKLSPRGIVVLDDYAWPGHAMQYEAHNSLARELGYSILTLPTGQGLIIK